MLAQLAELLLLLPISCRDLLLQSRREVPLRVHIAYVAFERQRAEQLFMSGRLRCSKTRPTANPCLRLLAALDKYRACTYDLHAC